MATLIAANYQSESSTAYGFMNTYVGPLKNNTLYTVRCRYKWDKKSTASTCPYAFYLWRSTWTNSYVITNVYNDYTTYVGTFTTPTDASSYDWNISCYANAQYSSGVPNGAVLSMDWYELWEGDVTTFSLTDAIALSNNKSEDDFLAIQNGCQNTGYFSTAEPINALRSWMGYYYKTGSSTSYGDWSYSGDTRTRTVTTYDNYSNGKKVQTSSSTQTETATTSYGNWSYNWTTTGNSTRTRSVTYTWSDGVTKSGTNQTETGGTRYIVLDNFSDGVAEGGIHNFSAAGGSITARTVSHDYWPNTSGTQIQTVVITGVTVTCTGFTCTTSGSTVTITAASKGTNESAANQATLTSTKSGWQTRSYGSCKQAANVRSLSSVYTVPYKPDSFWITDITGSGSSTNWATVPASGGYLKSHAYANYTHTSGSSLNNQHITTDAVFAWSGSPSWITTHSNGGYYVNPNCGTTDTRNSTGTYSYTYNGVTKTCTEAIKQNGDTYTDSGGVTSTTYGNWGGGAISFNNTSALSAAADSRTVTIQPWSRIKTVSTTAKIRTWVCGGTETLVAASSNNSTEYYTGTVAVSENGSYTSLSATSYTASSSAKTLTLTKSTCGSTSTSATTVTITADPTTSGPSTTTASISQQANQKDYNQTVLSLYHVIETTNLPAEADYTRVYMEGEVQKCYTSGAGCSTTTQTWAVDNVTSNVSWITFNSTDGTIRWDENTTSSERRATLTIKYGSYSRTETVIQAAGVTEPMLIINTPYYYSSNAGDWTVTFKYSGTVYATATASMAEYSSSGTQTVGVQVPSSILNDTSTRTYSVIVSFGTGSESWSGSLTANNRSRLSSGYDVTINAY